MPNHFPLVPNHFPLLPNHFPLLRAPTVIFAALLALSFACTAVAQSGRRVRKPAPAPVSIPEPSPPPEKTSSEVPKPLFTFMVGMDRFDSFANIPLYAYDGVMRSFTDRLDDNPTVKVDAARRDMSRGDAITRAKAEKETYVVWLQLRVDTMSADDRSNRDLNNVNVEYSVFAPVTGKTTTSGRTYPRSYRNKGVIPGRRTSSVYGDYSLNQAAREAAERILAAFKIGEPRP